MSVTKTKEKRKYFRVSDLIPIALIILVAFVSIWHLLPSAHKDSDTLTAVISVDSQVFMEVDLSRVEEPYDLSVPVENSEAVVVHITPTGVSIKDSPCPDKLCVNTGTLTRGGQSAVCLPMRLTAGSSAGRILIAGQTGLPIFC